MQLKKALAIGSMLVSMAGYSVAAYASEASNETTGPDSNNKAKVEVKNDLNLKVKNDADFDANLKLDFNTGKNEVKKNTTAGDNESGDVDIDVEGDIEINQSGGLCDCLDLGHMWGGDHSASNENTGPKSKNEATVKVDNKVKIDVKNDADVDVNVKADANTGKNESSYNTTVGDTSSGDVSFNFKWTTTINQGP
jgi:hypothetical protein